MSHLVPCPACNRHVRHTETRCPFCAVRLDLSNSPAPGLPTVRLGRAALFTFGATLVGTTALVACGGESESGDDDGGGKSGSSSMGGTSTGGNATGGSPTGGNTTGGFGGSAAPAYGLPATGGTAGDMNTGGAGGTSNTGGAAGFTVIYGGPPAGGAGGSLPGETGGVAGFPAGAGGSTSTNGGAAGSAGDGSGNTGGFGIPAGGFGGQFAPMYGLPPPQGGQGST